MAPYPGRVPLFARKHMYLAALCIAAASAAAVSGNGAAASSSDARRPTLLSAASSSTGARSGIASSGADIHGNAEDALRRGIDSEQSTTTTTTTTNIITNTAAAAAAAATGSYTLINITSSIADEQLAVEAAAGLANRDGPVVYVVRQVDDEVWLQLLLPNATFTAVSPAAFLNASYATYGCILYDGDPDNVNATQLLPAVVTLAGGLDLVPLSLAQQPLYPGARVGFDTVGRWGTPEASVQEAAALVLNQTTSLAFQDPQLLISGWLADWMVAQRLFVNYLNESCVAGTADHDILAGIVSTAPWPTPVRVYGYNSMDVAFGGDLFEAETNCINTMGQIATAQSTNLQFWSFIDPFIPGAPPGSPGGPMIQPPPQSVAYNPNTTYVALVYGDMDNINFVQTFGREHMQERVATCTANASACFPLTWTLSPNLLHFAPAMLRWYYTTAATTGGLDWFIMPPSGTLYSYPGQMPLDTQANYVAQQNAQALLMDTRGVEHWEWELTWDQAFATYFPRYVGTNGTRIFMLNNVPWVIPILEMLNETYRIFGDVNAPEQSVVAFRPAFNWMEGGGGGGIASNASVIADILNIIEPGTITYVYTIQNTPVSALFELVPLLAPHVQLVGYEALASLAFQQSQLAARSAGTEGSTSTGAAFDVSSTAR